jgi:single-stranded DNA-binding protein
MENKNNKVTIQGTVNSEFEFSHEMYGERFYTFKILSERLSTSQDEIAVMVSSRLIYTGDYPIGTKIAISGQIRSYNEHINGKSKLKLFVFMQELIESQEWDFNKVELIGCLCKKSAYRKTPLGREITDMIVAVNRPYGKSDYIPSIAWGRNARYAVGLEIGDCVKISGRFQSREYLKEDQIKVAYELSTMKIVEVNESEGK